MARQGIGSAVAMAVSHRTSTGSRARCRRPRRRWGESRGCRGLRTMAGAAATA